VDEATGTTQQTCLASRTQTSGRCLIAWIFFLSLNFKYLNFSSINEILCGMLVDFPMIICSENGRLVSQLSWNGIGALWISSLWTSYPVWYWCPVNGQLVDQLSWYGTGAGMKLVLVVQLYWYGIQVLWCGQVWILDYWFVNSTWKMIVNVEIFVSN